jgi:adenine-specific DNA-methyltransferase
MEQITENHPLSGSQDLLVENIQKLKEIFPDVFSEGRVDFEKLQLLLGDLISPVDDLYGLNWWGKTEAIKESMKRSLGTLRPDKKSSKNWDTTENIYIEGDNLEVLKLLQKSYNGKIKMIYIDPPYNTGKDFVYKDDYKDNLKSYRLQTGQEDKEGTKQSTNTKDDGRFHSNWLNMIYPRLKLARNLLTEDGVVFISIDDNEVHNLRKVCDEIFGENNFKGQISVVNNPRGRDYGGIARMHEYLLVYSKNSSCIINDLDNPNKEFPFFDEKGGYELRELRNRNIAFHKENRPNLYYPFYVNKNSKLDNELLEISLTSGDGFIEVYPKESQGFHTVWRWGKEKSLENLNIEIAAKNMTDGGYMIVEKYRKKTKMARSIWNDKEDNSEKGTLLLKDLFDGKKIFDFPKSVEMIKKTLEMGLSQNDILLDFYSGSATTAHSIMQLNAEKGNSNKFIMVQLPEITDEKTEAYKWGFKSITEIGKERIRRAGDKIISEKIEELSQLRSKLRLIQTQEEKEKVELLDQIVKKLDIGFKVFKLDSSNVEAWNTEMPSTSEELKNQLEFSRDHLCKGRTEEDLLFELLLKQGLLLTSPIEEKEFYGVQVFNISHGELFISMSAQINNKVIDSIGQWAQECIKDAIVDLKPVLVLKDEAFKNDDAFKTNAELRLLNEFGFAKVNTI